MLDNVGLNFDESELNKPFLPLLERETLGDEVFEVEVEVEVEEIEFVDLKGNLPSS